MSIKQTKSKLVKQTEVQQEEQLTEAQQEEASYQLGVLAEIAARIIVEDLLKELNL